MKFEFFIENVFKLAFLKNLRESRMPSERLKYVSRIRVLSLVSHQGLTNMSYSTSGSETQS